MKIVSVVGARPQFIKAMPVSRVLRECGHAEVLVHTGQHYDYEMSAVFFEELKIPEPNINLQVGSGSHGQQTGKMLMMLEDVIVSEKPDWVLVYGDTNSTLAAAVAVCKLRIPMAHVEAGLRSFNRQMPEEHNRVITDHCSDLLFCPTQTAVQNLAREGITQNVHLVGDTMYDAVLHFSVKAAAESTILRSLDLKPKEYLLATVHRDYNVDDHDHLRSILTAFTQIRQPIVFPVHPRTRHHVAALDKDSNAHLDLRNLKMIDPVGYMDMLTLEQNARIILTDSGGVQKEAYFLGVPCVTLRPETEWVETVESGWNVVVGSDVVRIAEAISNCRQPDRNNHSFGDGNAASRIVEILSTSHK